MALSKNPYQRRSNPTRRFLIAESLIANGGNVERTYSELADKASKERPFFFKDRDTGAWCNAVESRVRLKYEISGTLKHLQEVNGVGTPAEPKPDKPNPHPMPKPGEDFSGDDFLKYVWKARDIVRDMNKEAVAGGGLPDVGTRAILDGAHAKRAGIPYRYSLHALALDWSEQVRQRVGIEPFDPTTLEMPKSKKMPKPIEPKVEGIAHAILPALVMAAHARRNIALIGPPGCGKTHLAGQLADTLGIPFGMLSMSGGVTRGDLTGTETISGFKPRPFPEIFSNGGVFLLDELDASNPRVVPVLNGALANEQWTNPATGEMLTKHADFVAVGAMNTHGRGATKQYTARERQDAALLDRFAIARFEVDYDRDVERALFDAICNA